MSDGGGRHPQYAESKSAALRLLASRARPREYLTRRLLDKGLARDAVEEVLDDLERAGYIDDEQYARDRIDELLRQSKRGARALTHKLIQEGLPRETAEQLVAERLEGEDMLQWALEVARERAGRLRGVEPDTARRRLYGYLSRRGFTQGVAFRATDEALSGLDEQQ
ncbi:MAG: regulatory protein RecX [Armatimonadota bacterium]|nr:regulatory protein RecX [Armatimonadota bacterium]